MNLATLVSSSARRVPNEPAVISGTEVLSTYGEFSDRIARRATTLTQRWGVRPGDAVAIWASNCPEYLEFLIAIWWVGGVAVPLSNMLHPREVADLLVDSRSTLCLSSSDRAQQVVAEAGGLPVGVIDAPGENDTRGVEPSPLCDVSWNDPAWIFYTSGTTGKPKGALLSHGNLMSMTVAYLADVEPVDERSSLLHLGLMSHASGLFALPFLARGAAQVIPESRGADPAEIWQLLRSHPRATFFVPPVLMRRVVAHDSASAEVAAQIGTLLVGAAPVLPADLVDAVGVFGEKVWNGYGQGETPCTISAVPQRLMAEAARTGNLDVLRSVGFARIATEVRVVDDRDTVLPDGEVGEIIVRGPTVMLGYLDRPEATADTLRNGWLHTGDIGRFDSGQLTLLDRSKDMVISGGANIYSREVEEVLIEFSDVVDVAVVGAPDDEWGERVVAYVVAAPGRTLDLEALDRHCLDSMARYKRPKEYHVLDSLPRNGAGKILKNTLRSTLSTESPDSLNPTDAR